MKTRLFTFACAAIFSFSLSTFATTHYVDVNGANPTPPYLDWSTAATNIQDAVRFSGTGDLVLVTNGVYATGGEFGLFGLSNRVTISVTNLTVQSVNGPAYTTIQGYTPPTTNGPNAVRCVWMANDAALIGFTIAGGATLGVGDPINAMSGGGIWCSFDEVVSNCIIVSNSCAIEGGGVYYGTLLNCILTNNLSEDGGGAFGSVLSNCVVAGNQAVIGGGVGGPGTLYNCTVSGNIARERGGGVESATGVNCIITGNSASLGGGVYFDTVLNSVVCNNTASNGAAAYLSTTVNSTIASNTATSSGSATGGLYLTSATNCIVYFNTSTTANFINYENGSSNLDHCCTFPLPASGVGNFTNPPLFVNLSGGDYHLQSTSPCINAGNNSVVATTTDLDGNPRIQGGTVDVGAYEYQTPTSILSYAWAQQYGIPTDGSADFADPDGDGMNNWQEWIAGTDPTSALSVLALLAPAFTNSAGVTVSWQSVTNQTYYLQRAADLGASPAFSSIQSNIVGQTGLTTFLDTTATNSNAYFYRVGVQQPYGNPVN